MLATWRVVRRAPTARRAVSTIESMNTIEALSSTRPRRPGDIPVHRYITFSIIAHIDHGKSSLSQVLLQRCGNVTARAEGVTQDALDTLAVEKARGITVKAVTASMVFDDDGATGERWMLNLIDTPGHADFSHEVRRSLGACDGALLLVDSSQGIEAQTLSVAEAAAQAGVRLAAATSKIDLPHADPVNTALAIASLGLVEDPEAVLPISAKTGAGVDEVLPAIVREFGAVRRARVGDGHGHGHDDDDAQSAEIRARPLRARILDSRYDVTRGVISTVQVMDGELREQQRISMLGVEDKAASFSVQEVGLLTPTYLRTRALPAGAVGYVVCGLRDLRMAAVGDTIADAALARDTEPLEAGFQPSQPALYASVFPPDGGSFDDMLKAVERLALNDPSVTVRREPPRAALGLGLRLGFLGLLHLDVFRQRLRDEFAEDVLFTAPLVPYRLERIRSTTNNNTKGLLPAGTSRTEGGDVDAIELASLDDWPSPKDQVDFTVLEPVVEIDILVPRAHMGAAIVVLQDARALQISMDASDEARCRLKYQAPWANVVNGLSENMAHRTAGYASMAVARTPTWQAADLVKVDVAINGEVVDALSFVTERSTAESQGRDAATRLKEHCPRQQFEVSIQARIGTRVLAKERIAPYRKDVLTKSGKTVGGGDATRKRKLLEKQKAGKARAKTIGTVQLSQDALWSVIGAAPNAGTKK